MKTRHVWILPPLDGTRARQGYVLDWRQDPAPAASAMKWQAQVIWATEDGASRVEWIPGAYLRPVDSENPRPGRA